MHGTEQVVNVTVTMMEHAKNGNVFLTVKIVKIPTEHPSLSVRMIISATLSSVRTAKHLMTAIVLVEFVAQMHRTQTR